MFENYVAGGGSKYVSDCISACSSLGHEVLVLANVEAFSAAEKSSFPRSAKTLKINIFERTQLARHLFGEGVIPSIIRKMMIILDPLFLCLNVANICRFLIFSKAKLLVSCNGGYPGSEASLAAVTAADLLCIPSALIIMSEPRRRRRVNFPYELILDHLAFSHSRQIVVNSAKQKATLIANRDAFPGNIRIIYNGIADNPSAIMKTDGRGDNFFVVGVICRLEHQKGVHDLIEAISYLHFLPDIVLRIIGEGSYRSALDSLCHELKVSSRVFFSGFKQGDELDMVYQSLDLYVLPSHWEGLPYGILEAMRSGLPIVATNVGGISEAIRDGVDGILVKHQSPESLKNAILDIYNNPGKAATLGSAARVRFLELFRKESMEKALGNLFSSFNPMP